MLYATPSAHIGKPTGELALTHRNPAVLCCPVHAMPCCAGAEVRVLYATPSAHTGKPAGELAAHSVTRNDGSFAVGPLPSDASYSVEVSKAGHVLQLADPAEDGSLVFASKQLAQVKLAKGGVDYVRDVLYAVLQHFWRCVCVWGVLAALPIDLCKLFCRCQRQDMCCN